MPVRKEPGIPKYAYRYGPLELILEGHFFHLILAIGESIQYKEYSMKNACPENSVTNQTT